MKSQSEKAFYRKQRSQMSLVQLSRISHMPYGWSGGNKYGSHLERGQGVYTVHPFNILGETRYNRKGEWR